jgi:hypothetical protein
MPRIFFAAALIIAAPFLAPSTERIHLVPSFKPGDTLRYQIESRTSSAGKTTTPIVNPEGATQVKQSANILLRLDVLAVHPGSNGSLGPMRLRATYEKSTASSESDAYDPDSAAIENQYNRLQGRSMEFTVEPDGKLTDVDGLEEMLSNPSAAQTVRSWMAGLSSSAGFPAKGISIGQKWGREQPLTGIPLAGLFWRTEATYLRNEPCPAVGPSETATGTDASKLAISNPEICAIILTRFDIVGKGKHNARADETPDDYRRNGLRTSGTWTGSGESLDSISLATARVIRSTQTSTQDVDFAITSTNTGSSMAYKGKIETQSQIVLLPPTPPTGSNSPPSRP